MLHFPFVRLVVFITIGLSLQLGQIAMAQQPSPETKPGTAHIKEFLLRDKFIEKEGGNEKGQLALELLSNASPLELQLMRFDEDAGLSLCASWYMLELQMKAKFVSMNESAAIVPIPAELTGEFLAFIEGRLRIPPLTGGLAYCGEHGSPEMVKPCFQ